MQKVTTESPQTSSVDPVLLATSVSFWTLGHLEATCLASDFAVVHVVYTSSCGWENTHTHTLEKKKLVNRA